MVLNSIAEDLISVHDGLYDFSVEVLQEVQQLTGHAAAVVGNSWRDNRLARIAVRAGRGIRGNLVRTEVPEQRPFSTCAATAQKIARDAMAG